MTNGSLRGAIGFLVIALFSTAGLADGHASADGELITGKRWMQSDERAKIGFLYGVANFAEIEQAMQAESPPADRDSLVPVLVRGLDGKKINAVKDELDQWYKDHPDQIDRPLIEVLYMELALPNS